MSELKDLVSIAYVHNVSECASFCFENEGSFFYGKMEVINLLRMKFYLDYGRWLLR